MAFDGEVTRLPAETAAKKFDQYCREQIAKYSSPDMTLFRALKDEGGNFELTFGEKDLTVSHPEYELLRAGKALGADHPLTLLLKDTRSAKVLYAHPLMEKDSTFQRDADNLAYALQKSYPEARVVRDPLSEKTEATLNQLTGFISGGTPNVHVIVADDTFRPRVTDYRIVQNMKVYLSEKGMTVDSYSGVGEAPKTVRGNGLIVITAHSNDALAKFVRSLGEAGAFQGQYVVFNSCQTPLTRKLVTDMMNQYGAIAVHAPEGAVQVAKVDPFMRSFAEQLTSEPGRRFADILRETVQRSGLNGVWTICRLVGFGGYFA